MSNIFNQENVGYSKSITREFFKNVYAYMFAALSVSGIVAYYTGTPDFFSKYFLNSAGTGLSPLFWVVSFAPVGLGLLIQMAYQRLSLLSLLILFFSTCCLRSGPVSIIKL